jgi:hypothetical protein
MDGLFIFKWEFKFTLIKTNNFINSTQKTPWMKLNGNDQDDKRLFKPNPLLRKPKEIEPVIKVRGSVQIDNYPLLEDCSIGLQQDFMSITWVVNEGGKPTGALKEVCKKVNYSNFRFQDQSHRIIVDGNYSFSLNTQNSRQIVR